MEEAFVIKLGTHELFNTSKGISSVRGICKMAGCIISDKILVSLERSYISTWFGKMIDLCLLDQLKVCCRIGVLKNGILGPGSNIAVIVYLFLREDKEPL